MVPESHRVEQNATEKTKTFCGIFLLSLKSWKAKFIFQIDSIIFSRKSTSAIRSAKLFLFLTLQCFHLQRGCPAHCIYHTQPKMPWVASDDEGLELVTPAHISLRWPNYLVNSVDKSKCPFPFPHRRSTIVPFEAIIPLFIRQGKGYWLGGWVHNVQIIPSPTPQ